MQHIGFDGKFEDSFVLGGAGSPEAQTLQAQYLISSTHFSLAGLISPVHTSAPIQTTTTGSQAWVCTWNVVIA